MRLPVLHGLIRRRLLVNYRVDAAVMARFLPAPFRPKLQRGYAIAGVCLIRLEQIRPRFLPAWCGLSSENAAHRVAVEWTDPTGVEREGVFIPRRDTSLWINHFAGGRIFPGEHHLAKFDVDDDGVRIDFAMKSRDAQVTVDLRAKAAGALPSTSCFASLDETSAYFEGGSVGFSVTREGCRLDGIRLETSQWEVRPLAVEHFTSSFFENRDVFPPGSVAFDHALVMRDVAHAWHGVADLETGPPLACAQAG